MRFRLSWWLLAAAMTGLATGYGALVVGIGMPGATLDWQMTGVADRLGLAGPVAEEALAELQQLRVHSSLLTILQILIGGATTNVVFAFGEEVGWRGWLHRTLAPLGFWRASLVTGLLWEAWHAPLIAVGHNYPTQRVPGVFLFIVFCVALGPILAWVRERADSVWAAAMLHGTLNAAAGVTLLVLNGSELLVGVQGLAGALVVLAAGVAVLRSRCAATTERSSRLMKAHPPFRLCSPSSLSAPACA
jgi:membrane protease YdiL (CAAX protease family)